jgi:hypothetical protein
MAAPVAVAKLDNGTQNESLAHSLLTTTRTLTGSDSTFSDPATAIGAYQWVLLQRPTGSSATITSPTAAVATLSSVDTVGTYRVMLIVTDNNSTPQTSETDVLKATDTAFIQVHVQTQHASLVKPATGERNWMSFYWDLVDAVDTLKGTAQTTLPVATTTVQGILKVSDVPTDASDPVALTVQRGRFTAMTGGQMIRNAATGNTEFTPTVGVSLPSGTTTADYTTTYGPGSPALVAFPIQDANMRVPSFSLSLLDAGKGTKYRFLLKQCTKGQFVANDVDNFTTVAAMDMVTNAAISHGPNCNFKQLAAEVLLVEGNVLLLVCELAPAEPGYGLTVNIEWNQRY